MATATPSRQSLAVPALVEFLQQAQSTTGDITIPPNVQAGFRSIFASKSIIDVTDLDSLVSALDSDEGAFCGRLGTAALLIFNNILRLSAECPSQERGYYMLAECLHPPRKNLQSKKKVLGAKHIVTSFNRFLDVNRSNRTRRAFGFFVLTLLIGSQDNKDEMLNHYSDETWRSLGNLILRQETELLKLLAGSIIRELLESNIPEDKFWPILETPNGIVNSFPRGPDHNSQWVWSFHSYLEKDIPQNLVRKGFEVAAFANIVRLQGIDFEADGESSILVTVNTSLSIMIPAGHTRSIVYLDIPFDRMQEVGPIKTDSQSQGRSGQSQSQSMTACCLDIELGNLQGWSHLINAKPCQADNIAIVFDDLTDAKAINDALLARRSLPFDNVSPSQLEYESMNPFVETLVSRSDPLDISLYRRDTDSSRDSAQNVQELTNIASDANSYIAGDDVDDRSVDETGGCNVDASPAGSNIMHSTCLEPSQVQANEESISSPSNTATHAKTSPVNYATKPTRSGAGAPDRTLTKGKAKARVDDGASKIPFGTRNEHSAQVLGNQASDSPPAERVQGKRYGFRQTHGESSKGIKSRQLLETTRSPVIANREQSQLSDLPRLGTMKISRQLRDSSGQTANEEVAEGHTDKLPTDRTHKKIQHTATEQRRSSTVRKSDAVQDDRVNIENGEAQVQLRKKPQMPKSDDEYEHRTILDRHQESPQPTRAPKVTMLVSSTKTEARVKAPKPAVISNTSRRRPKAESKPTQVSERFSAATAGKGGSARHEEEVDWSEGLQADDSDSALRNKKKQSQRRSMPAKLKKAKPLSTQRKAPMQKGTTTALKSSRPRRAAAVKANNKIQGLADNDANNCPSSQESAVVEHSNLDPPSEKTCRPAKPSTLEETSISVGEVLNTLEQGRPLNNPIAHQPDTKAKSTSPIVKLPKAHDQSEANLQSVSERDSTSLSAMSGEAAEAAEVAEAALEEPIEVDQNQLNHRGNFDDIPSQNTKVDSILTEVEQINPFADGFNEYTAFDELPHNPAEDHLSNVANLTSIQKLEMDKRIRPKQTQYDVALSHKRADYNNVDVEYSSDAVDHRKLNRQRSPITSQMQNEQSSVSHSDILGGVDKTIEGVEQFAKLSMNPVGQEPFLTQKQTLAAASKLHRLPQTHVALAQENESPATPAKQLFSARKLQAALSPLNSLGEQNEGGNGQAAKHVLNGRNRDIEQSGARIGYTDATHQPSSEGKLQAKQKRQLESKDTRQNKKSRAAGWKPHSGPYAMRATVQTPENAKPAVDRKPKLVHFDSSGPKNQGTIPFKKAKARLPIPSHGSAMTPELQPSQSNKRKFTSNAAGNSTTTDEAPNGKRRKGDRNTMHVARESPAPSQPQIPVQPSDAEESRKHNSQSSRVDEYGSPMPFRHSRQVTLAAPRIAMPETTPSDSLRADFELEDYAAFHDVAAESPQPELPVMQQSTFPLIAEPKAGVMSNSKHRPSSPNAPSSIITDMAAHRIQPSGHFVGLQTNTVVVPQNPQDPFLVGLPDRPDNNFMGRLRRSSQNHSKEVQSNRKEHDGKAGDATEHIINDPDKTLVDGNLSQEEQESSSTSDSSSSSNTSQSQEQPETEPSDDGSDPGGEWRRALRAEHRGAFDTLCEVAHHLVRNLIDKETALKDIIRDYGTGGNLLIDRFEEARQREHESHQAKKAKATATLLSKFQSAEEMCAIQASECKKDVTDLRSRWEAKQSSMDASIDAALSLFQE